LLSGGERLVVPKVMLAISAKVLKMAFVKFLQWNK